MEHRKETRQGFTFTRTFKEQHDLRIKEAEDISEGLIHFFTPLQLKATVAGLISLDDTWHLEYFPMAIDHTIVDLCRLQELGLISEKYGEILAERIKALQDLANEFRWICAYGCRLYI